MRRGQVVSGGRIEAWRAALAFAKEHRGFLAQSVAFLLGAILFFNLPWWSLPNYVRGLLTGALVVGWLWLMSWSLWVTKGLAFRIQGAFAEDVVTDELRTSRHTFGVVRSLKFDRHDVDQVVITRAGIVAVETKWHAARLSPDSLMLEATLAARNARTLRHNLTTLTTRGVPSQAVTAALVLCGPGRKGMKPVTTISTDYGPVEVVSGGEIESWLATKSSGPFGPDFAEKLAHELQELARSRDAQAVSAGPVLRWLARIS